MIQIRNFQLTEEQYVRLLNWAIAKGISEGQKLTDEEIQAAIDNRLDEL